MFPNLTQELRNLPFIRLLLPFAFGIIFQSNYFWDFSIFRYIIIILLLVWIYISNFKELSYTYRYIPGVIFYILLFYIGGALVDVHKIKEIKILDETVTVTAIINEVIDEKDNSYKTILKIENLKSDSTKLHSDYKIVCYFEKDSSVANLKYGDKILFSSRISEIKSAGNPHEFNYKKFLFIKGISGQTYLKAGSWQVLEHNKGSIIFAFAYSIRNSLAKIYKENEISGQELAVLQALTLGDKTELTLETRRSYVASGAMHILAVSGLHVGIIYFILNFLFSFLAKIKFREYRIGIVIKAVFLIFSLWFFAFLSGLSPSVMRAAVMFSFFVIGDSLGRKISIYNSIAASAFILLSINPFLINEVGFQLSYIAVISIVYMQPKIESLIFIRNKYLRKVWALSSVSIAAQIGVVPISLYYFHIFPNWFLLTNLIVIPLASIIVYLAALLFVTSWIPYVSLAFAFLLKYTVKFLNYAVEFVEKLPFSVSDNIAFTLFDSFILYALIISFALFFAFKNARFLQISLAVLTVILMSSVYTNYISANKQNFYIYNIRKEANLNFITKNSNILFGDSSILEKRKLDFSAKSNFIQTKAVPYKFTDFKDSLFQNLVIHKNGNYIKFAGKSILIIDNKKQLNFESPKSLNVDYVVLSRNVYVYIEDVIRLFSPKTIIFDSSNKQLRIERWQEECEKQNQKYFSVPNQGAFCLEM